MVGSAAIAYLAFHYGLGAHRPLGPGPEAEGQLFRRRVLGGLLMGSLPVAACALALDWSAAVFGLAWPSSSTALAWVGGPALVLSPILWRASKSPATWRDSPRLRVTAWTSSLLGRNALSWMVYLAGYETLFRGALILGLAQAIGVWPAVAAGTTIYVFQHLTRGPGECLGSLPMGILFALMTLDTGSVLPAWALHVLIAVGTESAVVRHNPELTLS